MRQCSQTRGIIGYLLVANLRVTALYLDMSPITFSLRLDDVLQHVWSSRWYPMTESSSILRSRVSCRYILSGGNTDQSIQGKMIPTHSQSSTKAEATSTPTSRGITEFTISVPGSSIRTVNATEPSPPRWRTTEFSFYGVAFLLVVPLLVWWPIRLSLRQCCRMDRGSSSWVM